MTELIRIIGDLAVCTTVLQFLSGVLICRQYLANRSTGETTSLPFTCCILSCALWLYYGVIKEEANIIIVNLAGVFLMTGYTAVFYFFTIKKSVVVKQTSVVATILFIVILLANRTETKDQLLYFIGLVASIFTLAAIGAPLSKLFYVIRVRNTECLPLPLIAMSFIVSILWTVYGYLTEDAFIECVNVVAVILSLAQLSLFVIYPRTPQSPLLPKNIRI